MGARAQEHAHPGNIRLQITAAPNRPEGPLTDYPWAGLGLGDHLERHADRLRLFSAIVALGIGKLEEHCAGYPEEIASTLAGLLIEDADRAELIRRMETAQRRPDPISAAAD